MLRRCYNETECNRAHSAALLEQMKDYYDGFCFDGRTRLTIPSRSSGSSPRPGFANYWYASASPTFIVEYMKGFVVVHAQKRQAVV